jgi:hypothetical protein
MAAHRVHRFKTMGMLSAAVRDVTPCMGGLNAMRAIEIANTDDQSSAKALRYAHASPRP